MSYFRHLSALPDDPLLGLMAAARNDQRPNTLDVSVGMYRDENGSTPVMSAIRRAQMHLAATQTSKAYEGQRGNQAFCDSIGTLCLGSELCASLTEKLVSFATVGGTGAVFAALALIRQTNNTASVWLSDPSWPNHRHIAASTSLAVRTYRYFDQVTGQANIQACIADISKATPGDAIIIQGPCHNPTGADLDNSDWKHLADTVTHRQILPIVDVAYHGLGTSLDDDLAGVRAFVAAVPECLICYSCSKNFGLYRDRAGALIAIAADSGKRDAVMSHLASLTRAVWSMPPAHGAALVDTILRSGELYRDWVDEVNVMRARLTGVRAGLCKALAEAGIDGSFLTRQTGMFSVLPLTEGAPQALRLDHAVYMPASGRINVAALADDSIHQLAKAIAPFLR